MSDIRKGIDQLNEPAKSISKILIKLTDAILTLEKVPKEHRGGKQATVIIMALNDIEEIFNNYKK